MGMRPSRRATLRPAQTCGPEPNARCRLGWRPTSSLSGSANRPDRGWRRRCRACWRDCRADWSFRSAGLPKPRRGSGGSRASVMIEKFAGVRGMVRSEFLDPSHTRNPLVLVSLMIPKLARTLAARCGELRNRCTSDGCRVHRPFSRPTPEWRASAPSRIRQIGKAHCQSTVGAAYVMGASVGLARPNQFWCCAAH